MSQVSFPTTERDTFSYSTSFAPLLTGPSATAVLPMALALVQREQELPASQAWPPARPNRLIRQEWVEIDPGQLWYWTAGWQAQEREAEEDFRAGRYEEFTTMDDFISSLQDLMDE